IYWCLQGARQFRRLAHEFEPDRPVYGLRSGHLAMDYTAANVAALAERYADEIVHIDPVGPYLLGGICQGSLIATAIARCLGRRGLAVALLVLVDTPGDLIDGKAYAGKALIVSVKRSRFNPLRRFRSPWSGWRKL